MRFKSFLHVSLATMLSRVFGFLRDVAMASYIGTGGVADAFFLALRLPNTFRTVFAEGAFNASFIPVFSRKSSSGEDVCSFLNNVFTILALCTFVLVVVAECFTPTILSFFAPGFTHDPDKMSFSVLFARISLPYLFLVSLVSFFAAILNASNFFFISGLAPVFLNVFMVGGLLVFAPHVNSGLVLSWSIVLAGLFQVLFLYISVRQLAGFRVRPITPIWDKDIKRLLLLYIPGVLSTCVMQIGLLVSTIVVSRQDRGLSWLYYADRACQLPLALVGVAIAVVLLPDLSKRLQSGDQGGMRESQQRAWIGSIALSLPASAGLTILSYDIIHVLFERGAFGPSDVQATSLALSIYALGLPAFIFVKVLMPSFFAREDTWTPLLVSAVCAGVNSLASCFLFPYLAYLGCALALVLSSWLNVVLLLVLLGRRGVLYVDLWFVSKGCAVALGTVVMILALLLFRNVFVSPTGFALGRLGEFLNLLGLICFGFCIYALSLWTALRVIGRKKPSA